MDTEKDKNVSCFTLDGVVAEMVIEVEDSHKPGFDDFKDLVPSPSKNDNSGNEDESVEFEDMADYSEEQSVDALSEKKEDKENVLDIPESLHNIIEDKNSNHTIKRRRKSDLNLNHNENETISDLPRYPGRKRQANKRYISDDMITPKPEKSEVVQFKENPKGEKRRKLDTDSKDDKNEVKTVPQYKSAKRPNRSGKEESCLSGREESDSNTKEESSYFKKDESGNNKEDSAHIKKDKYGDSKESAEIIEEAELKTEDLKQKSLRKLPFRKNKDSPDIPDLKPKVLRWNGVGKGIGVKLGDLTEITERIKRAKSVRSLYRVLFFQWPTNGQDLLGPILKFNGFPFDETSYEIVKRQSLMKIMLDVTISHICDILGVKKGSKTAMIDNILNFLLKPYGKVAPTIDPSMQPVVLLEKIVLDDKFFDKSPEMVKSKRCAGAAKTKMLALKNKEKSLESPPITPFRTTRNSLSRMKIEIPERKNPPTKAKESFKSLSTADKTKPSASKETNRSISKTVPKGRTTPAAKVAKLASKVEKTKVEEKAKFDEGSQKFEESDASKNIKVKKLKKKLKKSKSFNKQKVITKKSSDNEPVNKSVESDVEMAVDSEPAIAESETRAAEPPEPASVEDKDKAVPEKESTKLTKVSTVTLSDSSETESAEETKLITASSKVAKLPQKSPQRRKGKPLKLFPKISDSIQKANFSALQRLHILLFGSSDKAENLKGNILAFGGFPFLEGSDEWKQKHFLLSLLAQNNLREYLKLLCIEYSDDDQPTMINKLMRFLAAPSENIVEDKIPEIETVVVSSELTNKAPYALPKKGKLETKKKNAKKKEEKKPNGRRRKVLMSEEEARRLEASFAREQRALARDSRAPPPIMKQPVTDPLTHTQSQVITSKTKPPVADPHQLNALLQTVYKRRALKAAGAIVSTPNKGEKIKLGDIENIKFLVVTSNISDLEVLHQLIYMLPASKARIRKNILDFDGFGFNEDSQKYKERMELLNTLGYDISKRLSFLLGLCPLQTDIPQQDLNELIMYFLMSPCKSKQVVPITQMPADPTIRLPDENHIILNSSPTMNKTLYYQPVFQTIPESTPKSKVLTFPEGNTIQTSTPLPSGIRQKAKKSISSAFKLSPVKKVLLPPAKSPVISRTMNYDPKQPIGNIPKTITVLNSIHGLPTYSLPKTSIHTTGTSVSLLNNPGNVAVLNASAKPPNASTLIKVPVVNPGSNIQLMNQASKVAVLDAATKIPMSTIPNIGGQLMQNSLIFPNVSGKIGIQPQQNMVQSPLLPGSKMLVKSPTGISSPQEFLVQQQTPDGQQKTFKLIRLPPNHPLASAVVKPSVQQTVSSPQVQQPLIITNALLRAGAPSPGFVVMKNSPNVHMSQQDGQTIPLKVNKTSSSVMTTSQINPEEFVLPDAGESADSSANDPDIEILNPLEDNPPTDDELFSSIQEIILSSNFEDITLRNVIERVSAQYPHHDLTHRHNYMKDCVKKIIIGT